MKPQENQTSLAVANLLRLRILVGFLGQRKQAGWWDCEFLSPVGIQFLEMTFPRTAFSAAARSTTEAAARLHDSATGRIGYFHLFRLPTDLESSLEVAADTLSQSEFAAKIQTKETALSALRELAGDDVSPKQGPVQIGSERKIIAKSTVQFLAANYLAAFRAGVQCFPYFVGERDGN